MRHFGDGEVTVGPPSPIVINTADACRKATAHHCGSPEPHHPCQAHHRRRCAEGPDDGDPGTVRKCTVQKNSGDRRRQGRRRQKAGNKNGSLDRGHHIATLRDSRRLEEYPHETCISSRRTPSPSPDRVIIQPGLGKRVIRQVFVSKYSPV